MKKTRGIRNNNPGNIDFNPRNKWLGQVGREDHPNPRFAKFESAEYGIRAIARLLITYQTKHKLNTVRQIIDRWAPPVENDTGSYARAVASALKVSPDSRIMVSNPETMRVLITSIIRHENGDQPYSRETIDEAMRMAGLKV